MTSVGSGLVHGGDHGLQDVRSRTAITIKVVAARMVKIAVGVSVAAFDGVRQEHF